MLVTALNFSTQPKGKKRERGRKGGEEEMEGRKRKIKGRRKGGTEEERDLKAS